MTHLSSPQTEAKFNRAIADLQAGCKILPTAITEAGAWRYAYQYDIVIRYYPEILEKARLLKEDMARFHIIDLFYTSLGSASFKEVKYRFQWESREIEKTIHGLINEGKITLYEDQSNTLHHNYVH